jgi:hypothetical protein
MITPESDHDILIDLRADVRNLITRVDASIEKQEACNAGFDGRLRCVEIGGSLAAKEAIHQTQELERRLIPLEACFSGDRAIGSWWDSTITKIGIISGVLVGIGAFVIEVYLRYGGAG